MRRWFLALVSSLAAFACGPKLGDPGSGTTTTEATATSTSTTTTTTTADSSDDSTGLSAPDCDAPLQPCGNDCLDPETLDLANDNDHCGSCDHACELTDQGYGQCYEGQCMSGYSPCVLPGDPAETCNDVCAQIGRACEDRTNTVPEPDNYYEACIASQWLFLNDPDGEKCGLFLGGIATPSSCDDPLQWTYNEGEGSQPGGIRCCCRQDW